MPDLTRAVLDGWAKALLERWRRGGDGARQRGGGARIERDRFAPKALRATCVHDAEGHRRRGLRHELERRVVAVVLIVEAGRRLATVPGRVFSLTKSSAITASSVEASTYSCRKRSARPMAAAKSLHECVAVFTSRRERLL